MSLFDQPGAAQNLQPILMQLLQMTSGYMGNQRTYIPMQVSDPWENARRAKMAQMNMALMGQASATDLGNVFGMFSPQSTAQQRVQFGQNAAPIWSMLRQVLPPEIQGQIGRLLPGGSAEMAAQRMTMTNQMMIDPLTGRMGLGETSAFALQNEMKSLHERDGKFKFGMQKGLGREDMGEILSEMVARGQMPTSLGAMTPGQRNAAAAASRGISVEDFAKLSDADQAGAITETQARRTKEALEKAGVAVRAVKEMFQNEGKDASIPEIFDAMEALTQGGLAKMDPTRIANTVRSMGMLAKDSKLSAQALTQMTAEASAIGKQLGLSDEQTRGLTMVTISGRAAMEAGGAFHQSGSGSFTAAEAQATIIRQSASFGQSEIAQRVAMMRRMVTQGYVGKDSETAKFLERLDAGDEKAIQQLGRMRRSDFNAMAGRDDVGSGEIASLERQAGENKLYTTEQDMILGSQAQESQNEDILQRTAKPGTDRVKGTDAQKQAFFAAVRSEYKQLLEAMGGNGDKARAELLKRLPGIVKRTKVTLAPNDYSPTVDLILGAISQARPDGIDTGVTNTRQEAQLSATRRQANAAARKAIKGGAGATAAAESIPEWMVLPKTFGDALSWAQDAGEGFGLNKDFLDSVGTFLGIGDAGAVGKAGTARLQELQAKSADLSAKLKGKNVTPEQRAEWQKQKDAIDGEIEANKERQADADKFSDRTNMQKPVEAKSEKDGKQDVNVTVEKLTFGGNVRIDLANQTIEGELTRSVDSQPVTKTNNAAGTV